MKTAKERVVEFVEDTGVVRPKDLSQLGVPPYYLELLEKEGKLQKLGRGLYASINYEFDENQSFIEVSKRAPNSLLCLLSALRFHELTTQNPFEVWIAIGIKSHIPKIDYPPIRLFRFSGKAMTEGVLVSKMHGAEIRVTNAAKTVADCFKYRNKIGTDVALEALQDGIRKKLFTLDELNYYAKICRVQSIMRPYIESIL